MTRDNETESTSKLNRSEQKPNASSQTGEHIWSVKDSATKAEIIAILQFAAQNVSFSCAQNLAACYQEHIPYSSIAKNVTTGPTKMSYSVSYELAAYFNQITIRDSRRTFLFYIAL